MSEVVKRLRERRHNVWEQAKMIADAAADENRAFTAEEESEWQKHNSELDALDRRMKSVIEGEQRAKDAEEAFAKLEGKPAERGAESASQTESELRAFLRGESGRAYEVMPDGPVQYRDLLKTGSSANVVPTSFYNRLVEHMIETAAILQAGPTVLNTGSGESLDVPKTTAHSTAGIIGEGVAITESDPTFAKVTLGAYKYARLIQVSREVLSDNGVDLEGYLARQIGRALGNAFGAHAITGTGTGQPRGVVTDATVGKTGPAGTSTTFGTQSTVGQGGDLLIDLFHSVIAPYRASSSAAWMMNDTTAAQVRKLKTTDGAYVWQPSLVVGAPDTILGKRVIIDPNVASPAANAKSVIFGDFAAYFVRLAGGVRFERSDDFAFGDDLVTFRAIQRVDGATVDTTGALKVFQHSAT